MNAAEFVESILHISEKPWSDYTEADYTIEQWHAACLVHLHDGPPTSKSQCKLPVKTPNGALNRNGVHAAAAALAGARSPLKASPEQKAKAASALRRYYSQLDETPPDSLKQSAVEDVINDILHFGVRGMRWGVRRKATVGPQEVIVSDKGRKLKTSGGEGHPSTAEARRSREIGQKMKKSGMKSLTNKELQEYATRMNLEQNVHRLKDNDMNAGARFAKKTLTASGKETTNTLVKRAMTAAAVAAGAAAVGYAIKKGSRSGSPGLVRVATTLARSR